MKENSFYNNGMVKRIVWLPEVVYNYLARVCEYLCEPVRFKNYDFLFRRSVAFSILLMILAALGSEIFREQAQKLELFSVQNQVRSISRHTFLVLNAVPRTTLAKRRTKVPRYKPTELALKEIDIPEPELGTLEVGPEEPETAGGGPGSPDGQARVRRPELMMLVPPVYPKDAEKKKIEGIVDLRVHVTPSGTVDQVEILNSSGHQGMDQAAVAAAKRTRFRPAIRDGMRVDMWIPYPIQFALNKHK